MLNKLAAILKRKTDAGPGPDNAGSSGKYCQGYCRNFWFARNRKRRNAIELASRHYECQHTPQTETVAEGENGHLIAAGRSETQRNAHGLLPWILPSVFRVAAFLRRFRFRADSSDPESCVPPGEGKPTVARARQPMPRDGVFLPPPHTKSHTVAIRDGRGPFLFPGSPVVIDQGWIRRVVLGEPK